MVDPGRTRSVLKLHVENSKAHLYAYTHIYVTHHTTHMVRDACAHQYALNRTQALAIFRPNTWPPFANFSTTKNGFHLEKCSPIAKDTLKSKNNLESAALRNRSAPFV